MDNVPRQTAQTEWKLPAKIEKSAGNRQQARQKEKRLAKFAERFHVREV